MALYHDAAAVLSSSASSRGSLRSRVYDNNGSIKSPPALVYALITECSKWDVVLSEVIDNAGILAKEPKLTPLLALLLTHDHLISKRGIACPHNHPLRLAIERHKARLAAELIKARIRRKCATLNALHVQILAEKDEVGVNSPQPRWIRINNLKTSLEGELRMTFSGSTELSSLNELVINGTAPKAYVRDPNVPDLLATNAATDEIINGRPYKSGNIILQDKASCFPAHLLLNAKPIFQRDGRKSIGDVLDACAAPGNKTSHAASILITKPNDGTRKPAAQSVVFACERDSKRSETLQTMLDRAGASKMVKVLGKQDFLALDPHEARFSNVTHLLLDPSCSGSGILGREDIPSLVLPKDPRRKRANPVKNTLEKGTKKRKTTIKPQAVADMVDSEILASLSPPTVEINRVRKLSNLQTRMIEHAFAFPSAQVVTYSTCSIHVFENEIVALRALGSESAKSRGWRLLRRYEQPDGLKVWHHRGDDLDWYEYEKPVEEFWGAMTIEEKSEFREACIRCQRGGPDGTMGFFVVGFVRDPSTVEDPTPTAQVGEVVMKDDQDEDEVWEGFSAGEEA